MIAKNAQTISRFLCVLMNFFHASYNYVFFQHDIQELSKHQKLPEKYRKQLHGRENK